MYMQPSQHSRSNVVWCVNFVIVKQWVFARVQGVIGDDVGQRYYPLYLNPTDGLNQVLLSINIVYANVSALISNHEEFVMGLSI